MATTVNSYIRMSKLQELRDLVEGVRSASYNDERVYVPLGKAVAIIDVYLMPAVEIKVEIEQ